MLLERSRAFWNSRPYLTTAEIRALADLVEGPVCAETFACRLGRDLVDTQCFLDALVAIGLLERGGDGYSVTPATRLYLETFVDR
jgi:predicted transcriptional regulator